MAHISKHTMVRAFPGLLQDIPLPLTLFRTVAGATLAAAAGTGVFGMTCTPGTVLQLISEAAQNNTKTPIGVMEYTLPPEYKAGTDLTITVNVSRTVASGTTLSGTIDLSVYEQADIGTGTTDLCATDAQNHATVAADYTFTITGTSLTAGDKILIKMTATAIEGGNTGTVVVNVNSVRVNLNY
jgi:hypothetical protein